MAFLKDRLGGNRFLFDQEVGVRTLEVLNLPILKRPDAGGDFIDQVVIVGDQQDRAVDTSGARY